MFRFRQALIAVEESDYPHPPAPPGESVSESRSLINDAFRKSVIDVD